MAKQSIRFTDSNGSIGTLHLDTDANTFTLHGALFGKPRASSTGAGMLAASVNTRFLTDDAGQPLKVSIGGEQYRLRIGLNVHADGETTTPAQELAKAKRKAEQARAKAAQADAALATLAGKR